MHHLSLAAIVMLVLAGHASRASSAPPPVAADALIFMGAKSEAEAKPLLSGWQEAAPVFAAAGLKPADGFPKLVKSDDVKGLKPGFFVWVVGYCRPGEGAGVLDALKAVHPGAYSRPVTFDELEAPCPTLEEGGGVANARELGKVGGQVLRAVETTEKQDSDDGVDESYTITHLHLLLVDPKTQLILASEAIQGAETHDYGMRNGGGGFTCELETPVLKKSKLVLVRTCNAPGGECGSYTSGTETITVTVGKGTLSKASQEEKGGYVDCD